MNLTLSDVELVHSFCDYYGLDKRRAGYIDYQAWASSIKYVFNSKDPSEKREYVKDLKYSLSNLDKPMLFDRLMTRLCLVNDRLFISFDEVIEIQRKVKIKLGIAHCHHSCYDFVRNKLFKKTCACCGLDYRVWHILNERYPHCSSRCAQIMRIDKKLKDLYIRKKVKRAYRLTKGENKLQKFVNYLSNQQRIKKAKKNKGNFKWR